MSRPVLNVVRLGLVSYLDFLRVQKFYVERLKSRPGPDWTLLLCEHEPVYTIGLRTGPYPDRDLDQLQTTGAQVHKTDRGGLITYHGPGQAMCYPIVHLGALSKGIRWYVSQLEQTVIDVCSVFGVRATSSVHTGVWVGTSKICAIGIHCSRRVTSHGLALNCDVDLAWFKHIVPCGLEGLGVTSLSQEMQRRISVKEAELPLLHAFAKAFQCEIRDTGDHLHQTDLPLPQR